MVDTDEEDNDDPEEDWKRSMIMDQIDREKEARRLHRERMEVSEQLIIIIYYDLCSSERSHWSPLPPLRSASD